MQKDYKNSKFLFSNDILKKGIKLDRSQNLMFHVYTESQIILLMVSCRDDLTLVPCCSFQQVAAGVVRKTNFMPFISLFHGFHANDLAITSVQIIFTKNK